MLLDLVRFGTLGTSGGSRYALSALFTDNRRRAPSERRQKAAPREGEESFARAHGVGRIA